jgi:hypothetical protein
VANGVFIEDGCVDPGSDRLGKRGLAGAGEAGEEDDHRVALDVGEFME